VGQTLALLVVPDMARTVGRRILNTADLLFSSGAPFVPIPGPTLCSYVGHCIDNPNLVTEYRMVGAAVAADIFNVLSDAGCEFGKEGFHLVDLGCGCGRIAAFLASLLTKGRYTGYDVWVDGVAWAAANLTSKASNLVFKCLNHGSGYEGQKWFPIPEDRGSADSLIATSLFTHLDEAAGAGYISEIGRILRPRALAYMTFFLRDNESLPIIKSAHTEDNWQLVEEPGVSFYRNNAGSAYLASTFDLEFVVANLSRASMEVVLVRRGYFRGERYLTTNVAAYQDLVVARRRAED
jgi:SAM-dependent methyltransferase